MTWNLNKPVREVLHADLARFSEDSPYKGVCLECSGVLLVYRHPETFELLAEDMCRNCGQHYKYLDIEVLRKVHG